MSNETKERRENTMCVMTSGPAITPQWASAGVQEVHIVLLEGHGEFVAPINTFMWILRYDKIDPQLPHCAVIVTLRW